MRSSILVTLWAAACLVGVPILAAAASPDDAAYASGQAPAGVIRVDLTGQSAGTQSLSIPRGKAAIVDLPVDARDVLVTNPQVANAVLRSPRQIFILGVAAGQTDAAFFDAAGRRILGLSIRVDQDYSALAQTLARLIPGSTIHVDAVNESVILSGGVANAEDATKAVQIAQQFASKPEQVVNMISIAGKEQVMLKVRIVEVDRTVIKQLGVNLSTVLGQVGSPQFMLANAAQFAVNGALLGGLQGSGFSLDTTQQPEIMAYDPITKAYDLPQVCSNCTNGGAHNISTLATTAGSNGINKAAATIDAFERVGLIRILAEPNLTAVSGESAKFLAGGEFPVPTSEDLTGHVSVEFKTFGVGLGFTPVVLSGGRISLKISTEVSEISQTGSFTLNTGSTPLTVPGLDVRRAETTVELPSGGAMMIAGLLKEETKQDLDSLPGLMTLPVLGALFRSRDYQEGETELMVIVTPYIVGPTSPANLQTPADGMEIASDAQTILLGQLNKVHKTPPAAVAGHSYQGPVGYVIE